MRLQFEAYIYISFEPAVLVHGRVVLVMLVSIAVHGVFLCEQPAGSADVFPNHPRLSWLCNCVAYATCLPKNLYGISIPLYIVMGVMLLGNMATGSTKYFLRFNP